MRIFNFRQQAAIPCYGSAETLRAIRRAFAYVFEPGQEGGGKPQLELIEVREPFEVLGRRFVPIPVWHGEMEVFGYRIGDFAYVTDCNRIPETSLAAARRGGDPGPRRPAPPPPLDALLGRGGTGGRRRGSAPRRTILTHMAHEVDHDDPLPPGVEFGYDGLVFDFD